MLFSGVLSCLFSFFIRKKSAERIFWNKYSLFECDMQIICSNWHLLAF